MVDVLSIWPAILYIFLSTNQDGVTRKDILSVTAAPAAASVIAHKHKQIRYAVGAVYQRHY